MGLSREQFLLNRRRFLSVMEYLERHLDDENLRLEDLAGVAHLSRFHFERVYTGKVKETPMATVRRLRLKRARQLLLAGTAPSITALAVQSGYGSVAAFSRAFSRAFDLPPTGIITLPHRLENDAATAAPILEMVELPAVPIVRHPFTGLASDVFNAGDEFSWVVSCSEAYPRGYRHWVVHPDGWIDPAQWPDKWVRMWHCTPVSPSLPKIPGAEYGSLPSGMYARFVLIGQPAVDIPHLIARIATETAWQFTNGSMLRHYPNIPHYTPVTERITHFYLPVARK